MVKKSTLALIGIGLVGISLLAARPKVITRTEPEPIPIPVPEPIIIPEFVETPLNFSNALESVKEEIKRLYGGSAELFTKFQKAENNPRQIQLGAERYKWLNNYEIVTKEVKL